MATPWTDPTAPPPIAKYPLGQPTSVLTEKPTGTLVAAERRITTFCTLTAVFTMAAALLGRTSCANAKVLAPTIPPTRAMIPIAA